MRWRTRPLFGDALRATGEPASKIRIGRRSLAGRQPFAVAPDWFHSGQQVTAPPGFCRTGPCKTLVWIGAGAVGIGVGIVAAGGEGNRQLGTVVALAGGALIVVALLVD
jgi:hypothetical protein